MDVSAPTRQFRTPERVRKSHAFRIQCGVASRNGIYDPFARILGLDDWILGFDEKFTEISHAKFSLKLHSPRTDHEAAKTIWITCMHS